MAIERTTTKEVFEAYVEYFLAPALKSGQVVIMDNFSAQRAKGLGRLSRIEGANCSSYRPIHLI